MAKHTMNVSLTAELEEHVQSFVQKGMYGNQSEVVRAGLRLLLEREQEREAKLVALRGDVVSGLRQVQEGRTSESSAKDFKIRGRKRLKEQG